VGFSLNISDIPESNKLKSKIIKWEKKKFGIARMKMEIMFQR
jgi:hypothetical protein